MSVSAGGGGGAVYLAAARLLTHLAAELAWTRSGCPNIQVVHPGNMVPQYGCDQVAVRVAAITPSSGLPVPAGALRSSDQITYAVEFVLSVDRCYPTTEDNGMPAVAELDSAARDVIDDAAAMIRAGRCAFGSDRVILGPWRPRGPGGDVHGGEVSVTATVGIDCACDVEPTPLDVVAPPLVGDPRF